MKLVRQNFHWKHQRHSQFNFRFGGNGIAEKSKLNKKIVETLYLLFRRILFVFVAPNMYGNTFHSIKIRKEFSRTKRFLHVSDM